MTLDQALGAHPDVVATDLGGGETVLLHLESKNYFSLNPTGTLVWKGIEEGMSPQDICDRLQAEFDVSREEAERAVIELVAELMEQDLVTSNS